MSIIVDARAAAERLTPAPQLDRFRLVLFPARIFLALGWMRAATEKVIDPRWWTGETIRSFLTDQQDSMLPFLTGLTGRVGPAGSVTLAVVVVAAQFLIAVCLFTGRQLPRALAAGCLLNISFVALGAVDPSAFYLVLQLTLLLELWNRGQTVSPLVAASGGAASLFVAIACAPFIRTLHPHHVIDDPAIMLSTLALLLGATCLFMAVTSWPQTQRAPSSR